ncbi:hypothetical protein [Hyalangium versicolor]|uniref:hypothetical protein n=1 Tax=Hyalangium versicolor TaxID=2861190 RepID=UPI001CCE381F|nr:hypothetical protein [Hyalangium versicolor]
MLRAEVDTSRARRQMLDQMERPRVDENVGLAHDDGTPLSYADQFVVDEATVRQATPHVETFSTKQRDFSGMSVRVIEQHVIADSKEAVGKYGGTVEVRRPGHPLFERRVPVSRVHLVYDGRLLPELHNLREQMTTTARRLGVALHFHHDP